MEQGRLFKDYISIDRFPDHGCFELQDQEYPVEVLFESIKNIKIIYRDRINEIDDILLPSNIEYMLDKIGLEKVNSNGKFTKRFTKYMREEWGVKLQNDSDQSIIGDSHSKCIELQSNTKEVIYFVKCTNNMIMNLSSGDGHSGSCWIEDHEYQYSREVLVNANGSGYFFHNSNGNVIGRVWAIDYNGMIAFFNCYLDGFRNMRNARNKDVDSTIYNWVNNNINPDKNNTNVRIDNFYFDDSAVGNQYGIYINSGGFLLHGVDQVLLESENICINGIFEESDHCNVSCDICGYDYYEDDLTYIDNSSYSGMVCESCIGDSFIACPCCDELIRT